MNIVSNHNRLLRVGEGGSQEYFAGPNINITNHVISGKYWDNEINSAISSTSGDIVNEAFNQSTAWTEEQGYLTAHQDIDNLPYVQNSALGYNGNLISSISGDGFFAESANNSYHADDADHATYADSATHADSADFVATANFANSASSALNAEVANVAYTALTANFLDGGWEHDEDGFITAYNNSAFAGGGGGGRYEGISPIVVNNEEMRISAKSALLGVQEPLYFVEDSETATVIGVYESAFSGRDWTDDITAASANALNEAINQITAVELANSALTAQTAINANHAASSDSATYDSLGRKIVDTYLTAHQQLPDWTPTIQNASGNAYNSAVNWVVDQHYLTGEVEYTAGANIDITNHVVSGKDWTTDIQNASSYAYDQATAQIPDVTGLPYVENSALDYTPGGHLVSSISGDALYAVSAEGAFNAETANYSYVAETANYVADGWEYNASNEITGYSGSAIHSEAGGEGKVYTGVAPIVVDNSQTTGVISAQTARLGVQSPLYFVEDTSASTVIGISGDLTGQYIPYTATGTDKFFTNSAIFVSAGSGFVEINSKNDSYSGEAHIHVHQKPTNNGIDEWWAEIDGDGYGHIQQHWSASTGTDSAMWYEINGFTFTTGVLDTVAEWLTGDWINAKALYNHVNTASASWGGGQCIPYTATATKTFVTNSAIDVTGEYGPEWETYSNNITASVSPSGVIVKQIYQNLGYSSYYTASNDGEAITLSSQFRDSTPESRVITTDHDKIYSGSTLIVDVVDAAKTVKDNSASWGDIPTKVVATSADATGSNILYIVTGS